MIEAQPEEGPFFNCLVISASNANDLSPYELIELCNYGIQFIYTAPIQEGNALLSNQTVFGLPRIVEIFKQSIQ